MKIFKLPLAGLLFCTAPLLAGCGTSDKPEAPVSLTWEMGTGNAEPGYYENSFVLKNISGAPLPRNWTIYYSQFPRNVKQVGNPAVKVEPVNGNFFRRLHTEFDLVSTYTQNRDRNIVSNENTFANFSS